MTQCYRLLQVYYKLFKPSVLNQRDARIKEPLCPYGIKLNYEPVLPEKPSSECNTPRCRRRMSYNAMARSEKTTTLRTLSHKHKISLTCRRKNVETRPDREKAEHWVPHSEPQCQDHPEKKACAQLLPQPQEGLTSHCLTHCPASDTALCVTASLHCGGRGNFCWGEGIEGKPKSLCL